jgi:hypothetical protein
MDNWIFRLVILFTCCYWIACTQYSPELLIGTWKASTVVEEGDTLDLDLSNVELSFELENDFIYQHTQRDSMSGKFKLDGALINLFVEVPQKDTIIIQLSELKDNALTLRMNHEGNERLVTMTKSGE